MDDEPIHELDAVCRAHRTLGQQHPGVDVAAVEVIVTLLRTEARLARGLDQHFRPFGLTTAKFDLLVLLHRASEQRLTMWQISERLKVTRTNVTGLVDGLEREALVRRLTHPEDRRSVLVALTPQGEERLRQTVVETWRWMADLVAPFEATEKATLLRLLRRLYSRLLA